MPVWSRSRCATAGDEVGRYVRRCCRRHRSHRIEPLEKTPATIVIAYFDAAKPVAIVSRADEPWSSSEHGVYALRCQRFLYPNVTFLVSRVSEQSRGDANVPQKRDAATQLGP